MSSRYETFRQARKVKAKLLASAALSILLLAAGVSVADYSINSLLSNQGKLTIVSVKHDNSYCDIYFMNMKMHINTSYLLRDMNKLRSFLDR